MSMTVDINDKRKLRIEGATNDLINKINKIKNK